MTSKFWMVFCTLFVLYNIYFGIMQSMKGEVPYMFIIGGIVNAFCLLYWVQRYRVEHGGRR